MPDFDFIPEITAVVGGFGEGMTEQLFGKGPVKSFGGSHTPATLFDALVGLGGAALSLFGKSPRLQDIGTAAMVGSSWSLAARVPIAMGVKPLPSPTASSYALPQTAAPCGCGGGAKPAPFAVPAAAPGFLGIGMGAAQQLAHPYARVGQIALPGHFGA